MQSEGKKHRSFLALPFTAADLQRCVRRNRSFDQNIEPAIKYNKKFPADASFIGFSCKGLSLFNCQVNRDWYN